MVGKSLGLERMKALEEHQGLDEPPAGRIAIEDGLKIGRQMLKKRRRIIQALGHQIGQRLAPHKIVAQPVGQDRDHGARQRRLLQHKAVVKGRSPGILVDSRQGFIANGPPYRIARRQDRGALQRRR